MKTEQWLVFVKEVGFPAAFSVALLVAIVFIVRFLIKEHKEERERLYNRAKEASDKHAESNEKLAKSLDDLTLIIKTKVE